MACGYDFVAICPSNYECGGHQPTCGANSYTFTTISAGMLVSAAHLTQLEVAINQERLHPTRRGAATSPACKSNTPWNYVFSGERGVGSIIRTSHFSAVVQANNSVQFCSPAASFAGGVINAAAVTALQNSINATRQNCICNAYCSCNINCGCNTVCNCNYDGGGYYY